AAGAGALTTAAGRTTDTGAADGVAPAGRGGGATADAAPAGAEANSAEMSSAGSAMTPISAPMGADSPAGTRILRRTPAPNASISTSALSVSTSARMSPPLIRSPSFFSHLMILPPSIASESLGMTTFVTAIG